MVQLELAEQQFLSWKGVPFEKKQQLCLNLAQILRENKIEYAKIITKEVRKPISQAIAEVEKCAFLADYYAQIENVLQPKDIESDFGISRTYNEPMGVILGIMPWNFPFWQVIRFAVPTILAGNTVLFKHAAICQQSAAVLEEAFLKSQFPKGVFTHIEADYNQIEKLLAHPQVKAVSLTGSEKAGSIVAQLAGKNIKKSLLELGGNDAFIVLADADLPQAAQIGAYSRLQNCGQTCIAAKRFIVHELVKDEFIALFVDEFSKYYPANPFDDDTILSGMARKDLADELQEQYHTAIKHGASIIKPLERISETEFAPGILLTTETNPILNQEVFGPLAFVIVADNDAHALQIANNTEFGLGNAVWTNNREKAMFFAQHLQSGTVAINSMTKSDPRLPFGGIKKSGYGTELSVEAFKEFTFVKTIVGNI
ncbi:MAG: aldehyde dehydrogenase family protein [Bacteroidota bacterium]|nr:aldehyde dehydrogenase family protein [Bacteroidota bacterium]